jgi:hypothetical protein
MTEDIISISVKKDSLALETEIRGTTAHMFSIIENCLARIILITNKNDREFQFSKLMLAKKLEITIKVLTEDYPIFFNEYKQVFDSLVSLTKFRNQMIHCKFNWEDPSLETFSI